MKKQFIQLLFAVGVVSTLGACKDFQEINKDPNAVPEDQVKIDYLLNSSIYDAQQNPHIAERMFILYWDRVSGYERNGGLSVYSDNDGWSSDYYSLSYINGWLKNANLAISLGNKRLADPTFAEAEKPRLKNIVQMARIWRAYLLSEFSDNFGPSTISEYNGTIVTEMKSVDDVYKFILSELKDAVATIKVDVVLSNDEKKNDAIYEGDLAKWQRYANSMRMRFAIRVGNQAEFETAVVDPAGYISEQGHIAGVLEKGGWDPTTAVMSRSWNQQHLSLTFANLTVGLGGVEIKDVAGVRHSALNGISDANYAKYVKDPQSYLGMKMDNYIAPSTNVINAQYMMDFIPNHSDPRLYMLFSVPGVNNENANYFPQKAGQEVAKIFMADQGSGVPKKIKSGEGAIADTILLRAAFNLPVLPYGSSKDYGSNFSAFSNSDNPQNWPTKNAMWRNAGSDNGNKRIFFGPWESYFLIAEAALKGWATPMSDQAAYEAGIAASFTWHGISNVTATYTASQSYNRVGTSVAYNHTAEASNFQIDYVNFQNNLEVVKTKDTVKVYQLKATPTVEEVTYTYPKGRYDTNNDKLTKIITQKYLANSPYLPLEAWNDYRRLNLPFIENPVVEEPITNMPWYTKTESGKFNWKNVPQRLKFPSSVQVNNPDLWNSALEKLGGENSLSTKLTWAAAQN